MSVSIFSSWFFFFKTQFNGKKWGCAWTECVLKMVRISNVISYRLELWNFIYITWFWMTTVVNGHFIEIKRYSENSSCTESCTWQTKHLNSLCLDTSRLSTIWERYSNVAHTKNKEMECTRRILVLIYSYNKTMHWWQK